MADILFKTDEYVFSYRVGGILIRDGKILLQKPAADNGYALIGGHVAFGETTDETLVREFREEIRADVKIERLLAVCENFFKWGKRPCQQINMFYLISLVDETQIPLDGTFKAVDELGGERIDLDICWVPLERIGEITVYPKELKEYILNLPENIVYFSHKE